MKPTFAQVTILLAGCTRHELVDHTFKDAEIRWMRGEELIADGYFGPSGPEVCSPVMTTDTPEQQARHWSYDGHLARLLRNLGTLAERLRNDNEIDEEA